MLHIILGILKVIGILLLAIIALILLMVLALLFVPVEYRLAGKKLEKVLEGRAAVSWLFGAIGLSAEYKGKKLVIHLKLFGFIIKSFGDVSDTEKKAKRKAKRSAGKRIGKQKKQKASLVNKSKDTVSKEVSEETNTEEPEPYLDEEEMKELFPDVTERQENELQEDQKADNEEKSNSQALDDNHAENQEIRIEEISESLEKEGEEEPPKDKKTIAEKIASAFDKCGPILRRFCGLAGKIISFIFSIPERILDIWGKLWDIADAGESFVDKIVSKKEELSRMAKPFLTDASKALYKRVIAHLLYLWKHYKPRRIQGWMKYGTGAPDVTGQLTGVLYMILPARADKFELIPEFTDKVFETDILIKGHIRTCHLIRVVFLLWRDKQLMRLIRRIRAKGGN